MRRLVFTLVIVNFAACHNPPPLDLNTNQDLVSGVVKTSYFEHFWMSAGMAGKIASGPFGKPLDDALVLVVEGDGKPWRSRFQIASDPTPEKPLMLNWLSVTRHPAVYLGRPCYFGRKQLATPTPSLKISGVVLNQGCDIYWYTFGRYSSTVVDSMVAAANNIAEGSCLILLGHSGGGTLAMLMARQLPRVMAVVTLAGNINVTAWQEYHKFTPLVGSLDPAKAMPLPEQISQIHIAAKGDQQILADWVEQESLRQQADFQVWSIGDHSEWRDSWVKLDALLANLKGSGCSLPG